MTCGACGYGPLVPGARYCWNCGAATLASPTVSATNWPPPEPEMRLPETDHTGFPSRKSVWKQLDDQFNAIGLWLDVGIRRVIRKTPSNSAIRLLFLVSALLVSGWLLITYSLQVSGQEVIVVGVVTALSTQLLFLVIAVVLSLYLVFMPTNWMRALQVLMWVCLARGLLILAWNLLVFARDWPYLIGQTNFLLVLVNYVVLVPFIGFVNVAPATYVWIRTRRPLMQP